MFSSALEWVSKHGLSRTTFCRAVLVFLLLPSGVWAQVTTTLDDSAAMLIGSPPLPLSSGIGMGFGGMIGQSPDTGPVMIAFDSNVLSDVVINMLGAACTGRSETNYDVGVIYIDSVDGGYTDTTGFTDASTPGAAAVSGLSFPSGTSSAPIFFTTGFAADFAIAFTNPTPGHSANAFLYALKADSSHVLVNTLQAIQAGGEGVCANYYLLGLSLQMLGLQPGQEFLWFGTLLNALTAYRSNEFQGAVTTPSENIGIVAHVMPPGSENLFRSIGSIVINEVDTATPGAPDDHEFVELFGPPNIRLDGTALITFNGADDQSYNLSPFVSGIDLDGETTNELGFWVLGNVAVTAADLFINNGALQQGADAVALYMGDGADYPNDTPVTSVNLIDALVYDTNDPDDAGLLTLLGPGMPQINEDGGDNGADSDSNQRCPDGGVPLDTNSYQQQAPTPGASIANASLTCGTNCNVYAVSGVSETTDATHEACEILILGPDFIAAEKSNVTANSGWEIDFMPGFTVEQGAILNANVCGQSLCLTSRPSPMPYGCHSCVNKICDIDPDCCSLGFNQACVDMVGTECNLVCE